MDLVARARPPEQERLRCPYCRDELASQIDEQVTCEDAAPRTTRPAWRELGRCTIMGCTGGVQVPARAMAPGEPSLREATRARIRSRVQRIARGLFTPVQDDGRRKLHAIYDEHACWDESDATPEERRELDATVQQMMVTLAVTVPPVVALLVLLGILLHLLAPGSF